MNIILKYYELPIINNNLTKSVRNLHEHLNNLLVNLLSIHDLFRYQLVVELINKTYLQNDSYIYQSIYTSSRILSSNFKPFTTDTIINDLNIKKCDKCTLAKSISRVIYEHKNHSQIIIDE